MLPNMLVVYIDNDNRLGTKLCIRYLSPQVYSP